MAALPSSRALPGCAEPEALQEGTGLASAPGRPRGAHASLSGGVAGYSPHPRGGPSGQAPIELGVRSLGKAGLEGGHSDLLARELVTQARALPSGAGGPGCSRGVQPTAQMGAVLA